MLPDRVNSILCILGVVLVGVGMLHTKSSAREPAQFVVCMTWFGSGVLVVCGIAVGVLMWRLLK